MKGQSLFSGEKNEKYFKISSEIFTQSAKRSGDNLHEISKSVFWKKNEKYFKISSEFFYLEY